MMIKFKIVTEKYRHGECEPYKTELTHDECSFREMLEKLRFSEPSAYPLPKNSNLYYTEYESNNGTREYYEQGIVIDLSYHPANEHAKRWMRRAYEWTHR